MRIDMDEVVCVVHPGHGPWSFVDRKMAAQPSVGEGGESTMVNLAAINESTVRASAAYLWMIQMTLM